MNNRTEEKLKDLSGMRTAVSELLNQAWERGYKLGYMCCEAEHEQQAKAEHEFSIGDVVTTDSSSEEIILGLTTGVDGKPWASVYSRDFDVPQMLPLTNLKYTGKHVNVLDFFNKAFIDISGGKEE